MQKRKGPAGLWSAQNFSPFPKFSFSSDFFVSMKFFVYSAQHFPPEVSTTRPPPLVASATVELLSSVSAGDDAQNGRPSLGSSQQQFWVSCLVWHRQHLLGPEKGGLLTCGELNHSLHSSRDLLGLGGGLGGGGGGVSRDCAAIMSWCMFGCMFRCMVPMVWVGVTAWLGISQ
jgi:hypothetical protein